MLSLFKIAPARRVTIAALKPFIDCADQPALCQPALCQPALCTVPTDWLQPHVLGFLSTAITLIAEAAKGPLRSSSLGAVQASVLVALTGGSAQLVGEEITLLSSKNDPEFMAGCQAAYHFVDALSVERNRHTSDKAGVEPFVPEQASEENSVLNARGLWREHVLLYLTRAARRA